MATAENLSIPEQNFGDFVLERMRRFGEREALVDSLTGVTYTYQEVVQRVCRLATGLQRIGVKEGDVVAMVTPNSIDYPLTFFAVVLIGAVFQPLNHRGTQDDISWAVSECSSKFIITLEGLHEKATKAADKGKAKVIVFGSKEGCISFQSLLEDSGPPTMPTNLNYKTTTAALFQTSGTTGRQKFVMHGHYSLIANIIQIYTAALQRITGSSSVRQTMIAFPPMFNMYCLHTVTCISLAFGARVVVMETFSAKLFLQLIEKYKVTSLHLTPSAMALLVKDSAVGQYDLSSVKTMYCGVDALSSELEVAFKQIFNLEVTGQGYGMTETLSVNIPSDKTKSLGRKLPSTEVQIVDNHSGEPVPCGTQGEITVRGPQVALGYLNRPDETAQAFRKDGWVYTGDIGYLDDDGFLFFVGRQKDIIKYNGLQVSPVELEEILLTHSGISDAAVVGILDEETGEFPKAFVVRKTGCDVSEEEIKTFIAGRVADHMLLRGGVQFIDKIPRNPLGKALRKELKTL